MHLMVFRGITRLATGMILLAACSNVDEGAKWQVVAHDLPASLMSVWAGSPTNVWVVGGAPKDAMPIVEHYDGTTWTKFSLDASLVNVNLWWVKGFDDGQVFIGGDHNTLLRTTNGSSFDRMVPPPGKLTVFGIWGAASDDVWAVGGMGGNAAFIWHYDGVYWAEFAGLPAGLGTVWKVNGLAANDVWMSATNNTVMHWTGTGTLDTTSLPDPDMQQNNMFSIGASSKRVITVGGFDQGVLYENDGAGWTTPLPTSAGLLVLSGVTVSEDEAYAVGGGGEIFRSTSASQWAGEPSGTTEGLHEPFIDPSGEVWAVGGHFNASPTNNGVLLHKGAALHGSFQ